MSHSLVAVPLPIPKATMLQVSLASMYTGKKYFNIPVLQMITSIFLQCCPEFSPQITGGAWNPGEEMVRASVEQSPMAPPAFWTVSAAAAPTLPLTGDASVRVYNKTIELPDGALLIYCHQ